MGKDQSNVVDPGQPVVRDDVLPSGSRFEVADVLGRHVRHARSEQAQGQDFQFALVAQVVTVAGRAVGLAELDDMPGGDVITLLDAVANKLPTAASDDLLPSGKRFEVAEVKGVHVKHARREQAMGQDYLYALVAQVATIDGQPFISPELDDMPGGDVLTLLDAVAKKV